MIRLFSIAAILISLVACSDQSKEYPLSNLEKETVQRALNEPETAYDYFMRKIEDNATPDEQAVYMYGIAVAREKLGDTKEAINDYLVAEGLGNKSAAEALNRLHVKRDQ